MKTTATVILALALPFGAYAQGFAPLALSDTGDTCYSWNGGNFSAGSFSKCNPVGYIKPVKAVALPPPVQPSPVMMPMEAPQTCAPAPKATRHIVKKKKPPVKC